MPSTTDYKKWDVVLVSFPFSDFTSSKRRPALIVSPDIVNTGRDVVIAFVTSQVNSIARVGDHQLTAWKQAGLPKPSMVRMKFATVDKTIIVKKIGQIDSQDRSVVKSNLLSFFSS